MSDAAGAPPEAAGRALGEAFLRTQQQLLWPKAATPRHEQVGRAKAIGVELRDFYESAEYLDDNHRSAALIELESFLQRLLQPDSAPDGEYVGTDSLVLSLAERIGAAAADLGYSPSLQPVLGTAHTGLPTALSYSVPGCAAPVVLIDSSMLSWIHIVASNLADLCAPEGTQNEIRVATTAEAIEAQLRRNPAISARLALATLAYSSGKPPTAQMLSPSLRGEALARILRDAIELFVVGHEIGHFTEGHFSSDQGDIGDADEVRYQWDQELEADGRGLELSIRALQLEGIPPEIGVLGADLFFGMLLLVDHVVALVADPAATPSSVISDAGVVSPTHPPPGARRKSLRNIVARSDPGNGQTFAPIYAVSDALHAAALLGVSATIGATQSTNTHQ